MALFKVAFPQTTLVLQPDSTTGSDTCVWDLNPNSTFGNTDHLDVTAWTANGNPIKSRLFIQFDLSSIPASASINSAFSFFFFIPQPD